VAGYRGYVSGRSKRDLGGAVAVVVGDRRVTVKPIAVWKAIDWAFWAAVIARTTVRLSAAASAKKRS
jgi:hypothetical protein